MNTEEAIALIERCSAEELFGGGDAHRQYRTLAKLVHPDAVGPQGARAFARLSELWHNRGVLRTTRGVYSTAVLDHRGDLANLYRVPEGHLKLGRDPSCNDLLAREAAALRRMAEHGDPRYLPYVPRLVETFRHRSESGRTRRANVIATSAARLHSLAEVARRRPDGLDPRDAAWMWRRLLVALGLAHRAGVVHGAVVPQHVLIEPDEHGVVLVDWCYSAGEGEHVPAIVPGHRDDYPPEVLSRAAPGPYTDIHMAAGVMAGLMGERAPKPLRRFADGCRLTSVRQRPDDAWQLLAEFDELLHRLYGPRTFRPFVL